MELTYDLIAGRIDHALLLPTMTPAEVVEGCRLADRYGVASVCIKPFAVPLAVASLRDSAVRVGTVVGFPHGGQSTRVKLAETAEALDEGAVEIDMVVNIGEVRAGAWNRVESEVEQIRQATRDQGAVLKLIFETCYLTDEEKVAVCAIAGRINVDFVKTSTGFGTGGATAADLMLMRQNTPQPVKLKASGGIRDLDTAIRFVELGSERLGLSKTAEILDDLCDRLNLPRRAVSRGTSPGNDPMQNDY